MSTYDAALEATAREDSGALRYQVAGLLQAFHHEMQGTHPAGAVMYLDHADWFIRCLTTPVELAEFLKRSEGSA